MSNFISLEQAIAMTARYREQKDSILAEPYLGQNILPLSETFDRSTFETLIAETDCTFIRIYLGMDEDLKIRIVAVGADSNDNDILPAAGQAKALDGGGNIAEDGIRCPTICPPGSPLNH